MILSMPKEVNCNIKELIEITNSIKLEAQSNENFIKEETSQYISTFFIKLEHILERDLKQNKIMFGDHSSFWRFLVESLSINRALQDGIFYVIKTNKQASDINKTRLFLRYILINHQLADTIQHCTIANKGCLMKYYNQDCPLMKSYNVAFLIDSLYSLNDINFILRNMECLDQFETLSKEYQYGSNKLIKSSNSLSLSSFQSSISPHGSNYMPELTDFPPLPEYIKNLFSPSKPFYEQKHFDKILLHKTYKGQEKTTIIENAEDVVSYCDQPTQYKSNTSNNSCDLEDLLFMIENFIENYLTQIQNIKNDSNILDSMEDPSIFVKLKRLMTKLSQLNSHLEFPSSNDKISLPNIKPQFPDKRNQIRKYHSADSISLIRYDGSELNFNDTKNYVIREKKYQYNSLGNPGSKDLEKSENKKRFRIKTSLNEHINHALDRLKTLDVFGKGTVSDNNIGDLLLRYLTMILQACHCFISESNANYNFREECDTLLDKIVILLTSQKDASGITTNPLKASTPTNDILVVDSISQQPYHLDIFDSSSNEEGRKSLFDELLELDENENILPNNNNSNHFNTLSDNKIGNETTGSRSPTDFFLDENSTSEKIERVRGLNHNLAFQENFMTKMEAEISELRLSRDTDDEQFLYEDALWRLARDLENNNNNKPGNDTLHLDENKPFKNNSNNHSAKTSNSLYDLSSYYLSNYISPTKMYSSLTNNSARQNTIIVDENQMSNSKEQTSCANCGKDFGFIMKRPHKCHKCQSTFCHYCVNNWVPYSDNSRPDTLIRLCDNCYSANFIQGLSTANSSLTNSIHNKTNKENTKGLKTSKSSVRSISSSEDTNISSCITNASSLNCLINGMSTCDENMRCPKKGFDKNLVRKTENSDKIKIDENGVNEDDSDSEHLFNHNKAPRYFWINEPAPYLSN
ncbi:probable serine/threonine-protein kinase DDB_G0283337 isoform X3 [Gordionus sp. m RMFG-2023]|uniref:probable serine/threonine-protein kinase DDB_G0283337 isoform X3 n=1 Tax=Gordionus sp. m RMFG-2023 TaxID=3053472 RepID=UPI0031FD967D